MKHTKTYLLASATALLLAAGAYTTQAQTAQGVSITLNGPSEPHPASILDVKGDDKGVLVPRVDYSMIDGVDDPGANNYEIGPLDAEASGMLVYVDAGAPPLGEGFYYYDHDALPSAKWKKLNDDVGPAETDEDWVHIQNASQSPQTLADGSEIPYFDAVNAGGPGLFREVSTNSDMKLYIRKGVDGIVDIRGYVECNDTQVYLEMLDIPSSYEPAVDHTSIAQAIEVGASGTPSSLAEEVCVYFFQGSLRMRSANGGILEPGDIFYFELSYQSN